MLKCYDSELSSYSSYDSIIWIEGCGTPRGIFYTDYGIVGGAVRHLLCVHNSEGSLVFKMNEELEEDCFVWNDGSAPSNTARVEDDGAIYYNSNDGALVVDILSHATISIYDMQGKLVDEVTKQKGEGEVLLSVDNGIYVVRVVADDGECCVKKIVI